MDSKLRDTVRGQRDTRSGKSAGSFLAGLVVSILLLAAVGLVAGVFYAGNQSIDMQNASKIINLPAPTASSDAATKGYVDAASSSLTFQGVTPVAYTANLGGLFGANQKCNTTYSGSHICMIDEIVKTGTAGATNDSWIVDPYTLDQFGSQCGLFTINSTTVENTLLKTETFAASIGQSIVLRNDGTPFIAFNIYYFYGFDCSNALCTSGTVRSLDTSFSKYSRTVLLSNGNPLVAYVAQSGGLYALKFYACSNPSCSSGTKYTGPSTLLYNERIDMKIRSDGKPVVAYQDTDHYLYLYFCNTTTCSGGSSTNLSYKISSNNYAPISLTLLSDNTPVVFSMNNTVNNLSVYSCSNSSCGTVTGSTRSLATSDFALDTPSGSYNPMILNHYSSLSLITCHDSACNNWTSKLIDSTSNPNHFAFAVQSSGAPIMAYAPDASGTNTPLYGYRCSDAECTNIATTTLDGNTSVQFTYPQILAYDNGEAMVSYGADQPPSSVKSAYFPVSTSATILRNTTYPYIYHPYEACSASHPIACCK